MSRMPLLSLTRRAVPPKSTSQVPASNASRAGAPDAAWSSDGSRAAIARDTGPRRAAPIPSTAHRSR